MPTAFVVHNEALQQLIWPDSIAQLEAQLYLPMFGSIPGGMSPLFFRGVVDILPIELWTETLARIHANNQLKTLTTVEFSNDFFDSLGIRQDGEPAATP